MRYENLHVCRLTPESHARTCGYWYTVTVGWGTSHTAFRSRRGLDLWLAERGLSLAGTLDRPGDSCPINGAYAREYVNMPRAEFDALPGQVIPEMSNGDYTEAKVTGNAERVVRLLGPNNRDRAVLNRSEVEKPRGDDWGCADAEELAAQH